MECNPRGRARILGPSGAAGLRAVPIRAGATNAFLQALAALAPIAPCASKDPGYELPLGALLPADTGRYMTYTGSLTTPPCDEGVTWILMNSGITATREEIDALKVVCGNARPVQVNRTSSRFAASTDARVA